jgi:ribosomal protein L7/L12
LGGNSSVSFRNDEKIAAIRRFRDVAWLGLKASHDAIEYRRAAMAV